MSLEKHHLKALKRQCLRVSGADAERFLNGMWTCDFKLASKYVQANPGRAVSGSGLLLNTKGKAIAEAVFFCDSAHEFLLMIAEEDIQAAHDALDRLLVADDVTLKILSPEEAPFSQCFEVPTSLLEGEALRVEPVVSRALDKIFVCEKESWGVRIHRNLLNLKHQEYWVFAGSKLPFEYDLLTQEEVLSLYIKAGVPEWRRDFGPDSLPLEFPLFHEISYHKGCYIGQEVIARATYRGHMTRGWVRVSSACGTQLLTDFIYSTKDPEKPIGKLTTVLGSSGMGLLRFAGFEQGQQLFQKTAEGSQILLENVENLLPEVKGN